MSGMRAVLLGVFLTVFVVDVSGFGMTLPAATPGLRVTSPRTCLSMSTLTQSRTRTLKNGPMRKRDQLGEWFDEITSEIFSGEKLPLSAKDLADHMLSSYWRESPESSDIFASLSKSLRKHRGREARRQKRTMTPGERTLFATVARSVANGRQREGV
mmetsp:Transcript_55834/g.132491  ORF Transcript_55834/g.132491 Transcript_55834/m.132491 type:complete len:157 (-) Transcript_55834:191-661(-)